MDIGLQIKKLRGEKQNGDKKPAYPCRYSFKVKGSKRNCKGCI